MGSTRFPNKVMQPISGVPMIELLLGRLAKARQVDQIVLATTEDPRNLPLAEHVRQLGYPFIRGAKMMCWTAITRQPGLSEAEVLCGLRAIVRWLTRNSLMRSSMPLALAAADFATNTMPPTLPDGLDVAVFTFAALAEAWENAKRPFEREHVTPYMRESDHVKKISVPQKEDFSAERWTVDEPEDFEVIKNVFAHFSPRRDFGWLEVLQLRRDQPDLFAANRHLIRNEGA